MKNHVRTLRLALVGLPCLALALSCSMVQAQSVSSVAATRVAAPTGLPFKPSPHPIDLDTVSIPFKALLNGGATAPVVPQSPAAGIGGGLVSAGDGPALELPVFGPAKTATDKARDSAAIADTGICNAYFEKSISLVSVLGPALKAMHSRDLTTLYTLLPAMDSALESLTPQEVKAEVCDGNHVNAYTDYQYFEISTLRANGVTTGIGQDLPVVKQPGLSQGNLAYLVGWTKFEQSDFDGALAAYGKGLAMFPHYHALQTEYLATLLRLKRPQDAVSYVDETFTSTHDLDDETRGVLFKGRAIALLMLGYLDAADQSLDLSLRYDYTDDAKLMLDQLRAVRSQAKK